MYGYPVDEAAPVALGAVRRGLSEAPPPSLVRFVLFDEATLEAYRTAADRLFG